MTACGHKVMERSFKWNFSCNFNLFAFIVVFRLLPAMEVGVAAVDVDANIGGRSTIIFI